MTNNQKCQLCSMTSGVDMHHEVPRAYGGEHGPQVPLCSGHHTLVHNLALQLYRHGDEGRLRIPPDVPAESRPELLRLVRTIVVGRRAYERARQRGAAPKRGGVVKLRSQAATRLEACARLLNCSQQDAVEVAINRLYQSLTGRAQAAAKKEQLQ